MASKSKWNQPNGDGSVEVRPSRRRLVAWAIVGVVLAVGVFLAMRFATNDDAGAVHAQAEKPKLIAEAVPQIASKPPLAEPVEELDPKKRIAPGYRHPENPNLPRKKYFPTVEEVERARLGPDGKPRKKSIYKTPLEQSLGILFTTKLGSPPPMLPSIPSISTPERLQKFFDTAMVYDKDAPKEVNENRMMMQQVQDELKRYLDEGGTASGFVEYYQNELRVAHEEWKMAQKMLIDMSRGGEDASVMREFRDRANAILAERGIKPLAVPPFVRQSMGEE